MENIRPDQLLGAVTSRKARDYASEKFMALEEPQKRALQSPFIAIRVDGKNFTRYTSKINKPYDEVFADDMDRAAERLATSFQGAVLGYTQSDEISLILTDTMSEGGQMPYGGVEAKLVSLAAATVTAEFNRTRDFENPGLFDARVFPLASMEEARQYLAYRQLDAVRNCVSSIARSLWGRAQTDTTGVRVLLGRLEEEGIELPARHLLGRVVERVTSEEKVTYIHKKTGEEIEVTAQRKPFKAQQAGIMQDSLASLWDEAKEIQKAQENITPKKGIGIT